MLFMYIFIFIFIYIFRLANVKDIVGNNDIIEGRQHQFLSCNSIAQCLSLEGWRRIRIDSAVTRSDAKFDGTARFKWWRGTRDNFPRANCTLSIATVPTHPRKRGQASDERRSLWLPVSPWKLIGLAYVFVRSFVGNCRSYNWICCSK